MSTVNPHSIPTCQWQSYKIYRWENTLKCGFLAPVQKLKVEDQNANSDPLRCQTVPVCHASEQLTAWSALLWKGKPESKQEYHFKCPTGRWLWSFKCGDLGVSKALFYHRETLLFWRGKIQPSSAEKAKFKNGFLLYLESTAWGTGQHGQVNSVDQLFQRESAGENKGRRRKLVWVSPVTHSTSLCWMPAIS